MKKLDVVNFALGMLGHRAVKGMDDEEVGDVVSAMWPIAVEFVVQEVKPVWSKRVERLHGEEDLRMPGFRMSAVLPDGCVEVVKVDGDGWCVFDGRLFWRGDVQEVDVVFCVKPDDEVHDWRCADGELLAAKLACLCAFQITGAVSLMSALEGVVKLRLLRAQHRARLQDMGRGGRDETVSPWGRRGIV